MRKGSRSRFLALVVVALAAAGDLIIHRPLPGADCDADGVPDPEEIEAGEPDCDRNGVPDACDLVQGQLGFSLASRIHLENFIVDLDGSDFDADGDMDLAVSMGQTVRVLIQESGGSFSTTQVEVPCNSLRAADLDGDGDRDLAVGSRQMVVLLRTGSGGFEMSAGWGATLHHVNVVPADIDGDGDLDLVSVATAEPGVSILSNSGDGTFSSQGIVGSSRFPGVVAVADLDGDGDADLAASSRAEPAVVVLTNTDGRGAFGLETPIELDARVERLGTAQLDGSGPDELIVISFLPARFCVVEQEGGGFRRTCRTTSAESVWFHHAADLDADGTVDLLLLEGLGSCEGIQAMLHRGLGDGAFHDATTLDSLLAGSPAMVRDMDGDGSGELVLPTHPIELDHAILVFRMGAGRPRPDCNANGIPDACESPASDLDFNQKLDSCDIADGALDCDRNGVPDPQDPDCDQNGTPDACDIEAGALEDANRDGTPDICEPRTEPFVDCNGNLVPDDMDLASGSAPDCNGNTVPDECDLRRFLPEPRARLFINRPVTSLAMADLDGNASADPAWLATPDFTGGAASRRTSLFIHRSGGGSWTRAVEYPAGPLPVQVLPGDLDGNGTQDLLSLSLDVPCRSTGFVAVHPNPGTAALGRPRVLARGMHPRRMASADLDGDADLDVIVVGEEARDALFVFLNDGAGQFVHAPELDVDPTERPSDLVAADLDRDGDADIAVALPRAVVPFSNPGSGRLAAGSPLGTTFAPVRLAAADLEGRGVPDIVVAAGPTSSNDIFVLENDGRGALGLERTVRVPVSAKLVIALDGDGDGKDDLAIAGPRFVPGNTPDAEQIHHLRSLGGRAFASPAWLDRNLWVMELAAGDIDADGDLDLGAAELAWSALRFYRNVGRQGFDPGSRRPVGGGIAAVLGSDLDGDTFDEVLVASTLERRVTEIPGDGAGGGRGGRPVAALEFTPFALAAGDLDADGDGDLVPAGAFAVQALLRTPDGSYAPQPAAVLGSVARHVVASDLDGDGDLDVVTANSLHFGSNDNVSVLANDGRGSLGLPRNFGFGIGPQGLCAVDLDADGDRDLAVSTFGSDPGLGILWNSGTGSFGRVDARPAPLLQGLFAADLDGNGLQDLAGASSDAVTLLENRGPGSLVRRSIPVQADGWSLDVTWYGFAGGDVDGDGDVDLALADMDELHLLENRAGLFPERPEVQSMSLGDGSGGSGPVSVESRIILALPDVNGDGRLDLAHALPGGDEVVVLPNRGRASLDLDRNGIPDDCSPAGAAFRRGEVNLDGATDMSDAISLLRWLFADGPGISCIEATDGNDDGRADLSDAVWLLRYLFLGAAPPYEPFAACGADPTPDALGCLSFPGCEG